MLKYCKTWTIYINFLAYISWHIKKFIYLCIAVNLIYVCIYMSLVFKFIYNALLPKCEPLFPSLAVLWNKSSAVSLPVKLPFFENLKLFDVFLRQSAKIPHSKVMNVPKYLFHFWAQFSKWLRRLSKTWFRISQAATSWVPVASQYTCGHSASRKSK